MNLDDPSSQATTFKENATASGHTRWHAPIEGAVRQAKAALISAEHFTVDATFIGDRRFEPRTLASSPGRTPRRQRRESAIRPAPQSARGSAPASASTSPRLDVPSPRSSRCTPERIWMSRSQLGGGPSVH